MFKGSFVLIESVDCQVAYSTLNYSKKGNYKPNMLALVVLVI